jgi:amidase
MAAGDLAAAIRARKVSSVELLEHFRRRVDAHNPKVNAVVVFDWERAREQAVAADAALAKGKAVGPLHGVPMTVKECFDVEGLPTTAGAVPLKANAALRHAEAVKRLVDAGAVIFGKTNTPLYAGDFQTYNEVYGTTNNPWDLTRGPGGSSGGSAAALASGMTPLELGSDIGGSIRNPAHFCGVYGHKPTYGVCSMQGQTLPGVAHHADISVIGPLARSAQDLELAFKVMAGPDAIDGAGWKLSLPKPERKTLRGWRVAVLESHPTAETDVSVQHSIRRLAQFLASKGAKVSDRALPAFDLGEAHRVFIQLLRGATSGRQTPETFAKLLAAKARLKSRDAGYYAQMVRATTQPHKDWLIASNRRHQMRHAWAEFFKDWDVLLCPNAATAAFPHSMPGERWERMITVNGRQQPVTTQMWWAGIAGMCHLPGTVAPIGLSSEGLPLSVQVVGPQYGDLSTIRFAQLIEREYYAFVPPPAYAG